MQHSRRLALLACLALVASRATAQAGSQATPQAMPPAAPPELAGELPGARWRGGGVMRFFGLHIYDARLWSDAAIRGDGLGQPLALELVYARRLVGAQIASRSMQEMQRVGNVDDAQAARWLQAMTALFPDVAAGDRLTGVHHPGRSARFYLNGLLRGEVAEADFARLFFGIWLSPKTSEPRLRAQLLGGGA